MNKQAIMLADECSKAVTSLKSKGKRNGQTSPAVPTGDGHSKALKLDPRNSLNDLTSSEWLPETVSVWTQRGLGAQHPDAQIERQHPAPFSFTDVSRLIRFFTKRGSVVLDPFVGVGSTLKACALEGRKGIGFELNPKYAKLAKQRLRTEVHDLWASADSQEVRVGDARALVNNLPENSLDFVVTSPPYWNILHKEDHKAKQERRDHDLDTRYSDHAQDHLHKMDYGTERPVLDVNRLREYRDDRARDEYLVSLLRCLMTRKSLGWSFEREYRVFIDLNNPKYCLFSDGHYYWRIPEKLLTRVILGFRCPLDETVVRKLLDKNGLVHTDIVRAKMCVETYAIKC